MEVTGVLCSPKMIGIVFCGCRLDSLFERNACAWSMHTGVLIPYLQGMLVLGVSTLESIDSLFERNACAWSKHTGDLIPYLKGMFVLGVLIPYLKGMLVLGVSTLETLFLI